MTDKIKELYQGQVELTFKEKGHLYLYQNKAVPGVTSSTGGMINTNAMMGWAVNESRKIWRQRILPGQSYDEIYLEETYKASWAHHKKAGRAAHIGNLVHEWINAKCRGLDIPDPVNPKALRATQNFTKWAKSVRFRPIFTERLVFSRTHGYAGTVDIFGEVKGQVGVVDLKVRNAIYDSMELQVTAYLEAIREEMALEKEPHQLPVERHILRIDRDTGELQLRTLDPQTHEFDFQAFLGALTNYRWVNYRTWLSKGSGYETYFPASESLLSPQSTLIAGQSAS